MIRELFVPGQPVPQGSKKLIKGRMIEVADHRLQQWRSAIGWRVKAAGWQRDTLTGPVRLELRFVLPRPLSHLRGGEVREGAPYWHRSKPDISKLQRAVEDALTDAGAWSDDCLVAQAHCVKHYGTTPGVHITVEAIGEGP